jgi:hypothetical protein
MDAFGDVGCMYSTKYTEIENNSDENNLKF